jgi:hypothetical protein
MEISQLVSQVDRFAWYLTTPLVVFEIILNKTKIGALMLEPLKKVLIIYMKLWKDANM